MNSKYDEFRNFDNSKIEQEIKSNVEPDEVKLERQNSCSSISDSDIEPIIKTVKSVSDGKTHLCVHCTPPKPFPIMRKLTTHLDKDHGVKYFQCIDCSAGFNRKDNYVKHMKEICKSRHQDPFDVPNAKAKKMLDDPLLYCPSIQRKEALSISELCRDPGRELQMMQMQVETLKVENDRLKMYKNAYDMMRAVFDSSEACTPNKKRRLYNCGPF